MKGSIGAFSHRNFHGDPYSYYSKLRQQAPIHSFEAGFWTISKHKDVVDALKRPDLFSSRTGMWQSTPVGEDPPIHTRLRRIASKLISRQSMGVLEKRMRETTGRILMEIQKQNQFDLMGTLANDLPFSIIWEILGIPETRRAACFEWLRQLKPDPDLERQLAQLPLWGGEGAGLTEEQRVRFIRFMLIAATDTTRNLIGNATMALLKHPKQMNLARQEKKLLPSLIEEALRYDTPIPVVDRRTTREISLQGILIPPESEVFVLLASANRDEDVFEDADEFRITRDAGKHLAFGEGPHYCLGAQLGKLEAQIAMEGLLYHLKGFETLAPLKDAEYIESTKLRGLASLPLSIKK